MADNTDPKLIIQELYEAALQGDETLLQDLLHKDPLLLHRPLPSSTTPPLHLAFKLGHTKFVLELLRQNPSLVEELDPNDKSSLLHLAARNGHLDLVPWLVSVSPRLCFARDVYGWTPVHVAVLNGQLHVLEELLTVMPVAARERVVGPGNGGPGDTILHLCVKYNQSEALKLVVRMVGDTEMLNATDVDGNTILHVAAANKRLEIVRFLLKDTRLKKNTPNSNGLTEMDVFKESRIDLKNDGELRLALQRAKVLSSEAIKKGRKNDEHLDWLEKQRSTLMVVASLIATMAFQAGLNPPGGAWQDDTNNATAAPSSVKNVQFDIQMAHNIALAPTNRDTADQTPHTAGSSIMAQLQPKNYQRIKDCNTAGLVLSMSSILLLITGFPCYRRFFMALIMVIMWVAVFVMIVSYLLSVAALAPSHENDNGNKGSPTTVSAPTHAQYSDSGPALYGWWVIILALLLVFCITVWTLRYVRQGCCQRC